jgi:hypothetical protein
MKIFAEGFVDSHGNLFRSEYFTIERMSEYLSGESVSFRYVTNRLSSWHRVGYVGRRARNSDQWPICYEYTLLQEGMNLLGVFQTENISVTGTKGQSLY